MSSEEKLVSDVDENDLEIIQEGEDLVILDNEGEDLDNVGEVDTETAEQNTEIEEGEQSTKKIVKPKRVIKNPQPKLNSQTLQEPKGLSALPSYFDRVKFKGCGYEERDLNALLKTYQYWFHRLVPKFTFDDCIHRLESLGTKKPTQTHIKRIRMGLDLQNLDAPIVSDEEENNVEGSINQSASNDQNDQFDQLLPIHRQSVQEMTEEQMERIRENKEKAQRLREEKLRKIQEKAKNSLDSSNHLIQESGPFSFDVHSSNNHISSTITINDISDKQGKENEINSHTNAESEEVKLDNLLNYINSDLPNANKHNKKATDNDSGDDISDSVKKHFSKKGRFILESDEDEDKDVEQEGSNKIPSPQVINIEENNDDVDINTILNDVNTDPFLTKSA